MTRLVGVDFLPGARSDRLGDAIARYLADMVKPALKSAIEVLGSDERLELIEYA